MFESIKNLREKEAAKGPQNDEKDYLSQQPMLSTMIARADVRFRGTVQGVHFRNFTRKYAKRMQVSGWVRNMPDGSVEAMFEGEDGAINEVIRMLTEDHPYARVEHVDVIWSRSRNEFPNFEIH